MKTAWGRILHGRLLLAMVLSKLMLGGWISALAGPNGNGNGNGNANGHADGGPPGLNGGGPPGLNGGGRPGHANQPNANGGPHGKDSLSMVAQTSTGTG